MMGCRQSGMYARADYLEEMMVLSFKMLGFDISNWIMDSR